MNTIAVRAEDIDFEVAAREHRPFLLKIAVASARNVDDAEDIVQEALMRGYRGIKRFRGDCPLRIWMSRIVVRVAINHHRSLARRLKRWVFFADLQSVHEDGSVQEFEPADPFATPLEILPEWYFFPVFQILRTVPNKLLGVLLMVSVPTGLLTVPFLENVNKFQNPFRRPVATTVFLIGTAVALWLGIGAKWTS